MNNVFGKHIDSTPDIKGLKFSNPVLTASGTCGYGLELEDFFSLDKIGGVVLKGTTLEPRNGNPTPRIAEFNGGIINSIGLQNMGIKALCEDVLVKIKDKDTVCIINVAGNSIEDYERLCEISNDNNAIHAVEVNISCPNVKKGGIGFGTDPDTVENLVKRCREKTNKPLIVKLTPNVTDIAGIAKIAEDNGADALTCINTFRGLLYDIDKDDFRLKNIIGGVSGPAIKPMALYAVYTVAQAVNIPIIGVGGIMNTRDALEFLKVGASLVQIGTAIFKDPKIPADIADDLLKEL